MLALLLPSPELSSGSAVISTPLRSGLRNCRSRRGVRVRGFSFHRCKRVFGTLVTQNTIPHQCTHMHTHIHKATISHSNYGTS